MKKPITARQKQLLEVIYHFISDTGYPPTFEEMRGNLNVSSNQSIIDLLEKLKQGGYLKRDEGARSIAVLPLGYEILGKPLLAPFLGAASAGTPLEMSEITGEWRQIADNAAKLSDEVFLLKIFGDSMINAGINDNDIVLVRSQKEFVSGDIVLAQIGDEATVKRFISDDKPPYIYLRPENPNYQIIPFDDKTELKGKIMSILQNEFWKPVK